MEIEVLDILTVRQAPMIPPTRPRPAIPRQLPVESIKTVPPTSQSVAPAVSRTHSVNSFSAIQPPASIRARPTANPSEPAINDPQRGFQMAPIKSNIKLAPKDLTTSMNNKDSVGESSLKEVNDRSL